jgi:hypothetical protein
MRYRLLLVCLLLFMVAWSSALAEGEAAYMIKIHDVAVKSDLVTVAFEVRSATGGEPPAVDVEHVKLIELHYKTANNPTSKPITLEETQLCGQQTNPRTSTLVPPPDCNGTPVELQNNGKPLVVAAPSATIGIIFDVVARDVPEGESDSTFDSARIIQRFLFVCASGTDDQCNEPRTKRKSPPMEGIGLFISPTTDSPQAAQQPYFVDFPDDPALRSELLRQLSPGTLTSTGPTKLFETLLEALKATAEMAQKRGGPALVLLVTNSNETETSYAAESIKAVRDFIGQPMAQSIGPVKIVAFRTGKSDKLDLLLKDLALASKGIFRPIQYKEKAWNEDFEKVVDRTFDDVIQPAPTSLYIAQYHTELLSDGVKKALKVQITSSDGAKPIESNAFPLDVKGETIALETLDTDWPAAVRRYLLVALLVALLISVLIVLLTGAARWSRSRSSGISR